MTTGKKKAGSDLERLDRTVAEARRAQDERQQSYRGQALKLFPWICGRCAREFDHTNVRELTVHHKDHNHDNNPPDSSNWELLCIYCHDNGQGLIGVLRRVATRRPPVGALVTATRSQQQSADEYRKYRLP